MTYSNEPGKGAREAIARMLVPHWVGGFERQDIRPGGGSWLYAPGTPNDRAYAIADKALAITVAHLPERWRLFTLETPPKHGMFIWAYQRNGRWQTGLAYQNVSNGWSDAYGSDAPSHATHWTPMPAPPEI